MIRIFSKYQISDIEKLNFSIDSLSEPTDLILPKNLSFGGVFGISTALSQSVAKWARSPNSKSLKPVRSPKFTSDFEDLAMHPHGLVSMFMAQNYADKNGDISRSEVLKFAAPVAKAMNTYQYNNTMKGQGTFLACFSGMKAEFINPLYAHPTTDEGLRSTSDFQTLTRNLLSASDRKFEKNLSNTKAERLASLIFELFENTNDHGTMDEKGNKFDYKNPNVRGILLKKISISNNQRLHKSDRRISTWTSRVLTNDFSDSQCRLELSIFDFGIGIAKANLVAKKENYDLNRLSFTEEETITRNAFNHGVTTKKKSGAGIGLDTTLECLADLGAAMRLRTGRICFWQDFALSGSKFEPNHYDEKQKMLSTIPGTLYTILIPL